MVMEQWYLKMESLLNKLVNKKGHLRTAYCMDKEKLLIAKKLFIKLFAKYRANFRTDI
jgi:hypothetical protein